MEAELILRDGFLDLRQGRAVVVLALYQHRVEQDIAVLAGFLGQVHGMVGMAQQRVGVTAIIRIQRDADAGRDVDRLLDQVEGRRDDLEQTVQRFIDFLDTAQAPQKQHELIAAQARDGIVAAHADLEPTRHADEQFVARLVAVTVVHRLESIQIQHADGQQLPGTLSVRQCLLQPVGEQAAIRQMRQRVEMRQFLQVLLVRLALADVLGDAGDPNHLTVLVADRVGPRGNPAGAPVRAADAVGRKRDALPHLALGRNLFQHGCAIFRGDGVKPVHAVLVESVGAAPPDALVGRADIAHALPVR